MHLSTIANRKTLHQADQEPSFLSLTVSCIVPSIVLDVYIKGFLAIAILNTVPSLKEVVLYQA